MLLSTGPVRPLGVPAPRLTFREEPGPDGAVGRRVLALDGEAAFELSWWCGTCQFLFRREAGAGDTLSVEQLTERLATGVDGFDEDVVGTFASLLPEGRYLPLLLEIGPRLIQPGAPGDYYAEEQVATWGLGSCSGLPEEPATAYYRTFETRVDDGAHLFEFVVPMLPPAWYDEAAVAGHAERLRASSAPTAVAVSTLDVCQPAMDTMSTDYYEHWCLTHFLLDGHHKTLAAAESGRPLRLLSLLAVDPSLATGEQVGRVPGLRFQERAARASS